jgi:hypothetical protein
MRRVKVVTSRDPQFLKTTYPIPNLTLIDHHGFVDKGERFVVKSKDGWQVLLMTESRATVHVYTTQNIHAAMGAAQR